MRIQGEHVDRLAPSRASASERSGRGAGVGERGVARGPSRRSRQILRTGNYDLHIVTDPRCVASPRSSTAFAD